MSFPGLVHELSDTLCWLFSASLPHLTCKIHSLSFSLVQRAPGLPLPAWESHVLPDKGWPLFCGSSYLQAPATWWQWLLCLWEVPDPALCIVFPYFSSEYHLTGSSDAYQALADLWIIFPRASWMFTRGAQICLFREGLEQLKMSKY